MENRKIKTVKFDVLTKGVVIDYQTIIEETIGNEISKLSCYDSNWDNEHELRGHKVYDNTRAYFIPDCDYEIIIRPKK
jgi:hypothetical protein|tara:strand:+ start:412 stop:645 length:234 start_codon:yes stop_codon:yes gene_type:complete